jgi:hypothetical protein
MNHEHIRQSQYLQGGEPNVFSFNSRGTDTTHVQSYSFLDRRGDFVAVLAVLSIAS